MATKSRRGDTVVLTSPPSPLRRRGAIDAIEIFRAKAPSPVERAGGEVRRRGAKIFRAKAPSPVERAGGEVRREVR